MPNSKKARVNRKKITEYLLCAMHPDGSSKARFFAKFGFRSNDWKVFADALKKHAQMHSVVSVVESSYGIRYTIDGKLETPDGRNPHVRSVWIMDRDSSIPKLITAYPVLEE